MKTYKQILEKKGDSLINLYKQALINADRVATGKTNNSFRFEVKEENFKVKFIIYSADHVRDLETGQTAAQVRQKDNASLFDQIQEWVNARNIGGSKKLLASMRIYSSLLEKGWNTSLPNRTCLLYTSPSPRD